MNPELYQQNRGSVTFTDDGERYINIFSSANESILAHEAGYVFEENRQTSAGNQMTKTGTGTNELHGFSYASDDKTGNFPKYPDMKENLRTKTAPLHFRSGEMPPQLFSMATVL